MRNVKLRRVAAVLTFFLLWAGVEHCVRYFTNPVRQSWPTIREERKAAEGTIDTVFVGASLFRNGIIPAMYDQIMGGRSFNYGTSGQAMRLTYYALEDLSETNPIQLAIIDISVNRLLGDGDDGLHMAKYVVLSHIINLKAKLDLLRECFTLDDLPLTLLYSVRDQLHFLRGTLSMRLMPEYFRAFLKYGYMPDPDYSIGFMGYNPTHGRIPDGGAAFKKSESKAQEQSDFSHLERSIALCREKGITPVLVSMPTTDTYLLYYDRYEALLKPVKELAQRTGALYLDFNLSRFRVNSLTDANFGDERHMNDSGARLFTPHLAEVLKKALAGEDVSSYFYPSYDAMIQDIDRVSSVALEEEAAKGCVLLRAFSLQGAGVTPVYRFLVKAQGAPDDAYEPLDSTGETCALEGVEPGVYEVRVEAYSAPDAPCDAYAERTVTVK